MKTNMIYGRYCSLLMCFTLSLAAQEASISKFGTDARMCDVFVKDGKGKMVPGTIVGRDADGWQITFPYETNRGNEQPAKLSQKELSMGKPRYQTDQIETNLRFLNDEDLLTLKRIDKPAHDLYERILKFRETHKNGGFVKETEEKAVWAKLVPILFELFTTVDLKERKKDNKLQMFPNMAGRGGTDWHKDYNDMGFTMMIDDSFDGSPLIYWPGKEPQAQFKAKTVTFENGASGMFDIEYVQGGKFRVTSVTKDLKAYSEGMCVRDLILEIDGDKMNDDFTRDQVLEKIRVAKKITFCKNSRDTSSVTYEDLPHSNYDDIHEWCKAHNMKIAPKGTKIALFEGKKTLHGRPPIPEDKMSSRGLAFYAKGKKKFASKADLPRESSAERKKRKSSVKSALNDMFSQRKKRRTNHLQAPPSTLSSISELKTSTSLTSSS